MTTFLAVMKIIGIVLLIIVAVLLFDLFLILFWPVRYYVEGRVDETDLETETEKLKERIFVKAGFSWFFNLIRGYISYPDEMAYTVKVLCFKIFPGKEKKKKESESENEELPIEMEEGFEEKEETGEEAAKEESSVGTETDSEGKTSEESGNETASDADIDNEDFSEEKKSFFDVLKSIQEIVVKIIKTPQNVFNKIKCTISSIYDKINMIKKTLENDIFKRAFEVTKKRLIKVIKMILPKKIRADFLIGMSDPTVTADILAAYGILYPVLVNKVFITPEFDRSVLKGDFEIKGRIRIFTLLWAAAVLYFNKDVKKTVKRFNKIIKS